jgi:asparagine synthase (glutamine-hydrolysing)
MCGIAGMLAERGRVADPRLLRAMTGILAHRGPDGDGHHEDGRVGLGHRRLSIIDLATGEQPMSNDDASVWITFNGEIYNYRELRRELESRGYSFRTASDTEVIIKAYEAFGPECVQRLRGMFAFAIWDARRRRLFLARDRAGIKPLVYAWDGRRLVFASEIKALLQDPDLARELDSEALRDYLTFLYVPSPKTIFRGIRKLPPASYLLLDADGGDPVVRRYWQLEFRPEAGRREAEWIEGLRAQLADAVQSHLVSDVPIGAFLSGGVDSGSVVALMARAAQGPVRTFSIGFEDEAFDEVGYARQVARRYGTDHYEFVVKPDALEALPRLAWQFDEPFADSSALPTYYVSKITREHVTVGLSGDGGDENFAGYTRYARALALHHRFDRGPGRLVRPFLALGGRLLPTGARGQGYLALLGAEPVERYYQIMTGGRLGALRGLLAADMRDSVMPGLGPDRFRAHAGAAAAHDYVAAMQRIDIETYLPEDILTKVDRTSMLVSLEARVPLLDHVLMEYVATMPTALKLSDAGGKAILKRAMADALPPDVLHRRKMGFGVPLARWFRAELGDHAREVLLDDRTRRRGLLDTAAVARLLEEHRSGRRDRATMLWTLLCLEEWARVWLDR